MPRGKQRRTQTGAVAQNIDSVPGQRYGEGVEQQAMQRAMPAPVQNTVPGGGEMAPAVPVPAAAPPADIGAMLSGAPVGMLAQSMLPNQAVTHGLSTGPGAGPEVLGGQSRTPLARTLNQLYERTGDPMFRRLLDRSRL